MASPNVALDGSQLQSRSSCQRLMEDASAASQSSLRDAAFLLRVFWTERQESRVMFLGPKTLIVYQEFVMIQHAFS